MPLNRIFHKSSFPVLLGLAAIAVFALDSSAGHSRAKPQAAAPLPQVQVAEVIHRPLREWQEFSGRLQAVNTVDVRPRVSGYVDRVAFTDGARVKKGQLLFQIDPRPYQAEVERLVAERARSVSDLQLARANRARAERLISAHAISREEYERQVAAEASAQGAMGSIDALLQEARLNREFTEVRAPIDGHASRALITAGNLVTSASLMTTLVSDDPVYVYFDADEQTYLRYAKAEHEHAPAAPPTFILDSPTRTVIRTRADLTSSTTKSIPTPAPFARAPRWQIRTAATRRACLRVCGWSAGQTMTASSSRIVPWAPICPRNSC